MRANVFLMIGSVVVMGAFIPPVGIAQPADGSTSVKLGEVDGPPGAKVEVSLGLASPAQVGGLELTLDIPPGLVFVGAETNGTADLVGAKLTAAVESGAAGTSDSQLRISLATPKGSQRRALPPGILVYLEFSVAKDSPPDAALEVGGSGKAETIDASPKPLQMTVKAGRVKVTAPAAMSCFFYMH